MIKIKKRKKSQRLRGTTTHGWGARKKHKGSGHRGGFGMAGTGKRADHKKMLITKKYGNKYFGKQGITSKGTKRDKGKFINLRDIEKKFSGKKEINLKDYKVLGDGEITKAITIKAQAFTKSAKDKIEKAGGEAILSRVRKVKEVVKVNDKEKEEEVKNKKIS
jgi:large subunit ribosomal protein L15